jgi:hypothetical protein
MYALMRGIAVAAVVGTAYDMGWLWSPFVHSRNVFVPWLLFVAGVLVALRHRLHFKTPQARRTYCVIFLAGTACAGVLVCDGSTGATGSLSIAAYVSLLIAFWASAAYREFTWVWARTVYQHFYQALRSSDSNPKAE